MRPEPSAARPVPALLARGPGVAAAPFRREGALPLPFGGAAMGRLVQRDWD